ncbi:MAG: hypothetical protein HPY53_13695 [Brevinematales bacterium]|nr:hypothetical protein [Brevinematales bacterium]
MEKCGCCSTEIGGEPGKVKIGGKTYCGDCAKVCRKCGRVMINGKHKSEKIRNLDYCPECYASLLHPVCAGCGKSLTAKRAFTHLRSFYCPVCITAPLCPSCGRPHSADTDKRCPKCGDIHGITPKKAMGIYQRVVSNILFHFNLLLPGDVPIHLVQFSGLQNYAGGTNLRTAGLFVPLKNANILGNIYIVPYYPEEYFVTVLTHELTHAWQYLHWKRKDYENIELREGMAIYIEYEYAKICHYYAEVGAIDTMLEVNRDLPHIAGFRRIQELSKTRKPEGLLTFFQSI